MWSYTRVINVTPLLFFFGDNMNLINAIIELIIEFNRIRSYEQIKSLYENE